MRRLLSVLALVAVTAASVTALSSASAGPVPAGALPADAVGVTTRVNVNSRGLPSGNWAVLNGITANGLRVLVFTAAPLDPADTNKAHDLYVHDRATLTTTRVALGPGGAQIAGGTNWVAELSADGTHVAYAVPLGVFPGGPPPQRGARETMVRDLRTGAVVRGSIDVDGTPRVGDSVPVGLSGDGRVLLFDNSALGHGTHTYWRDLAAGVSVRIDGLIEPMISDDGRYLLGKVVPANPAFAGQQVLVRRDRLTGQQYRVDYFPDHTPQENPDYCLDYDLSADGSRVLWTGCPVGPEKHRLVYLRDFATDTITQVTTGVRAQGDYLRLALSGDGTVATFTGGDHVPDIGEPYPLEQGWRVDLTTGTWTAYDVGDNGQRSSIDHSYNHPTDPDISYDGSVVGWWSYRHQDIVPGDYAKVGGVFIRDVGARAVDRPTLRRIVATGTTLSVDWDAPTAPSGSISRYRVTPQSGAGWIRPFDSAGGATAASWAAAPSGTIYRVDVQGLTRRGLGPRTRAAVVPTVSAPSTVSTGSMVTVSTSAGGWGKGYRVELWRRPLSSSTWSFVQSRTGTGALQTLQGVAATSVQWEVRVVVPGAGTSGRRVTTRVR